MNHEKFLQKNQAKFTGSWKDQDEHLQIVGGNDLALQTWQVLKNLETAIKFAEGSLENIVMLRIYKVNYQQQDGTVISDMLKEKFGTKNPPASTWINVKGLANAGFLVEIEAQAVL